MNEKVKQKKIPKFANSKAEAKFWATQDSADYVDWKKAKLAQFPNLKLSTTSISLRLPEGLLNDIKVLANQQDVPYQSLIKLFLSEKVNAQYQRQRGVKRKALIVKKKAA
jgi:predicted DNA binding CopG/RHH family protein